MRDLFAMWRNTRMIVLTAVTAAVYAAILIPFKAFPVLIPGVTEFRPGNVVPIVCSLLFGPAGAWGAAFGNLIGDFFGTIGPGSIFGFIVGINALGGIIGPFLAGWVFDTWGSYQGVWLASTGLAVTAVFLIYNISLFKTASEDTTN